MCGFTLMNNPAPVEDPGGRGGPHGRDYDEISEALATTPATSMRVSSHTTSTQCGRVIHEDDWTIMFANLQGAAG